MKGQDLKNTVVEAGLTKAKVHFTDANYALPTSKWLLTSFYDYFLKWLSQNDLTEWRLKFDCDNFACLYYAFAHACHTKSNRKEEGIAVGEMWYEPGNGGAHAINIACTEKGVIYIEPQTGKEVELTEPEKESCWFIRF